MGLCLREKLGCEILITGTPDEEELMRQTAAMIPGNTKVLKHLGESGISEIRISDRDGTFRIVYTVEFKDVIAVLHVFQKKSKEGIETPKKEIAKILGISAPKVSALMTGKINDFSNDTLMNYLTLLGCNVEIRVIPRSRISRSVKRGEVKVKRPMARRRRLKTKVDLLRN